MARSALELRMLEVLEPQAAAHGIDIVDVEVAGSDRAPVVRIRIDHADESAAPITLDEIASHNAWIDGAVDEIDPFVGSYTIEVSSPGMDRPLRRPHDFERFAGERVLLTTTATEGRRRFTGTLRGLDAGKVVLACDDGLHAFSLDDIKTCNIKPNFEADARAARERKR